MTKPMKLLQLSVFVSLALLATACTTISDDQVAERLGSAWIGKSITDMIKAQPRPPSRQMVLPDQTTLYIWRADSSYTTPMNCQEYRGHVTCQGGDVMVKSCEISAFTDAAGVVTLVKASGCSHLE